MHLTIYSEIKGEDQPKDFTREYAGWGQGMFFAVYRPTGALGECGEPSDEWDEKDLLVFMGSYEKEADIALKPGEGKAIPMEPVSVLYAIRFDKPVEMISRSGEKYIAQDRRTLIIETQKGQFYLPDPYTREKDVATFNHNPITCWG